MQNLVEILAIEQNPFAIIPCIRISRGVWVASSENAAPFTIEMKFLFKVNGVQAPAVVVSQQLSAMTFDSDLDSRNTDVHGQRVVVAANADRGSIMQVSARVLITDRAGTRIEVSDLQIGSVLVP